MRLTLKGFLLAYCQELSGLQTQSIKKLCASAAHDAPRVAEPLFLYAMASDAMGLLLKQCAGTWMESEYRELASKAAPYGADVERFAAECELPQRFANVLDAFRARNESLNADRRVSALMREKTLAALETAHVTKYRLCKDLNLNMGNVYAYLSQGDTSKVSRSTARRIMEYASAATESTQRAASAPR